MPDFYNEGFNDGYGKHFYGEREYPQSNGDRASYERGIEDGQRRGRIRDEIERENGWD